MGGAARPPACRSTVPAGLLLRAGDGDDVAQQTGGDVVPAADGTCCSGSWTTGRPAWAAEDRGGVTRAAPVGESGAMPTSAADLLSAAYNDADRTIDLRRRLHRHPEIGLHLPRTQATVLEAFADLPIEVTTGKSTSSVVGVLRGARPGPTYLLRGDMDALPVHEDTGLPFASEVPGAMHACGHDTHVAMLLGAARLLAERRDELAGQVVFMVQPGEEGFHGARYMLEEGLLDVVPEAPVSGAFALHISSTLASGSVNVRPGPMMAAADQWTHHRARPGRARLRAARRRRPHPGGGRDRAGAAVDGHPAGGRVRPRRGHRRRTSRPGRPTTSSRRRRSSRARSARCRPSGGPTSSPRCSGWRPTWPRPTT